jgi:hypothetical protein
MTQLELCSPIGKGVERANPVRQDRQEDEEPAQENPQDFARLLAGLGPEELTDRERGLVVAWAVEWGTPEEVAEAQRFK